MQRNAAIVIGVVVVVVAAIVGFLVFGGRGDEEPSPTPEPSSAAPSPSPTFNAAMLEQPWTILYVGTDVNEGRAEAGQPVNTDALMLVHLSEDQSTLTLVSLPRDTVDLPLPDGGTYQGKINGVYSTQGLDTLVGMMETLYDVPIDGHVVLDMDDFESLVAAVDGVDVDPPEPISDPAHNVVIEAGPQELDAPTALGYVRTRVDQDYGRMGRQQEVIMALIDRLVDPEREVDLGSLLDGLDSLETDLPLEELPTLMELARRATEAEVQTLVIQPPLITFEGDRGDGRGYILEPDVEAIRAEVQSLIGE
ncbi:MAG TPA: LCP family protein [Candidatus Limnocylindria bacterium]|nr:LCP family protein [Candidatus Limnocylindria bacterium]